MGHFSLGMSARNFLWETTEPTAGVAHWDIRDELPDPLSSFVPELKPRLGGVFLLPHEPPAGAPGRAASCRVAGVDRRRALQLALLRHGRSVRLAFLPARAEPRPGDVVLGRAVLFPILADLGLLADALRHGMFPVQTGAPGPETSFGPCDHTAPRHGWRRANGVGRDFFAPPAFLFCTVCNLDNRQCRVPPSPPAIRDMKKPRQRKSPGLRIQTSRSINGR